MSTLGRQLHRSWQSTAIDANSPSRAYLKTARYARPPTSGLFNTQRKLLVLDPDGILLYRSPPLGNGSAWRTAWPRPYVRTFKRFLFHPSTREWLDTAVWSSGQKREVELMTSLCFGASHDLLVGVWADPVGMKERNDHGEKSMGQGFEPSTSTAKDLNTAWTRLGPLYPHSLYTTVFMVDSLDMAPLQPFNLFLVPRYDAEARINDVRVRRNHRGNYDDILLCMVGILEAIRGQQSVANWLYRSGPKLRDRNTKVESWWMVDEARQHWRKEGESVLRDLGIKIEPAVIS